MRSIFLIALMFTFSTSMAKVKYGVVGGINFARTHYLSKYDEEIGLHLVSFLPVLGLKFDIPFNEKVGLQTGLVLVGNGDERRLDGKIIRLRVYSLNLPVQFKYNIGRKGLFGSLGAYLGYGLWGKYSRSDGNPTTYDSYRDYYYYNESVIKPVQFSNDYQFIPENYLVRRWDYGLSFGLGYNYGPIEINLIYNLGLANTNPYRYFNERDYNRSLQLTTAWYFNNNDREKRAKVLNSLGNTSLGFKIGLNYAKVEDKDSYYNDDRYLSGLANLGLVYTINLNKYISIQSEIDYTQKGDKYFYYTGYNFERTDTRIRVDFLEMPFLLKLKTSFKNAPNLYMLSGVGVGMAIGETHIDAEKKLNNQAGFRKSIKKEINNRIDKIWQLGGGISYTSKGKEFFIEGRYCSGSNYIFQTPSIMKSISVSTGILFNLQKSVE